jgi:hypothetical protein
MLVQVDLSNEWKAASATSVRKMEILGEIKNSSFFSK